MIKPNLEELSVEEIISKVETIRNETTDKIKNFL
jgi:hypothetical protein